MNILLIDTSRREALIALIKDDSIIASRSWVAERDLGRRLIEAIDDILAETGLKREDIGRVAVHKGPGNYSALRNGIVTASVLSWVLSSELVEVSEADLSQIVSQALVNTPVQAIKPQYD